MGEPKPLAVPAGTSLRDCIAAAGGPTVADPVWCIGGLLMGETTENLDRRVTKTTGGVMVLAREHRVIARKLKPSPVQNAIGQSACDRCRYCTEYCPRYRLGDAVEPHQVRRSLAFTATGAADRNEWAARCCSCGFCTLCACPEELDPKEACDPAKAEAKKAHVKRSGAMTVKPYPMRDGRRVPIKTLTRKMPILQDKYSAPFADRSFAPARVVLLRKQSAGSPGQALVRAGDRVGEGQGRSDVPEKALGVAGQAAFAGSIAEVTAHHIVLTRSTMRRTEKSIGWIELSSVVAGGLVADSALTAGIESLNVATLIRAADACAKSAHVQRPEVRVALALGGKAFVTMTGDIAAVQTAVAAGRAAIADAGILVNAAVNARPHPEVSREVI